MKMVDVIIQGEQGGRSSVFLFTPRTKRAREWVNENVNLYDWQWIGEGFAVENRFARELAQGMIAEGLEVR